MAHDVTEYGAIGDGRTLDTAAVQSAIDAAHGKGGGTVVVPGGARCLIGTIELRSHVTLHLEPGAAIVASTNADDYASVSVPGRFNLFARDAVDIAIKGTGEIDGSGIQFMDGWREEPYIRNPIAWRPRSVGLYGCRRVTVRDITLRDSPSWGIHLVGCDDVLVSGARILNDLTIPNCDGIDPDHCTNVRISDCTIQAGDDCIVLKCTRQGREMGFSGCSDVTVTNCTLTSTSAAIKIGTESEGDFRNITVSNCVIRSSSRGLAIQLRDSGNVENVLFSHCTIETRLFCNWWWGHAEPIYVTALPRDAGTQVGRVRHVRFDHIACRSENGVFIAGCEVNGRKSIQDVELDSVRVEVDKWSKWPGGSHDRRPMGGEEHGGLTEATTNGVFVEHAEDVRLRNVDVAWGENRQVYWGDAVVTREVTRFRET